MDAYQEPLISSGASPSVTRSYISHSMRDGAFQPAKSIVLGKGLAMNFLLHGRVLSDVGRRREFYILAGDRVRVMERENVGLGPQRRRGFFQLVGTGWIGWIRFGVVRHVIRLGKSPALVEIGVVNGAIVQYLELPDAVFLGINIFVKRAFPPLPQGMRFIGVFVMAA